MNKDFVTESGTYKLKYAPTEDVEDLIQYMLSSAQQLNLVELVKSFTSLEAYFNL